MGSREKIIRYDTDIGLMKIRIEAELHPTEDPDRVRTAILNIFPGAIPSGTGSGDRIVMKATDIQPFFTRISVQKIRDTARSQLLRSINGSSMRFGLSKQAAFSNRVNFSDVHQVLGNLEITIAFDDPEALINNMLGVAD